MAGLVLIAAVLAVHLRVADSLGDRIAASDAGDAMPARIDVAYVREMALSAPAAVATPTPAVPMRPARPSPPPPARAASAPLPEAMPVPAVDPEASAAAVAAAAASSEPAPMSEPVPPTSGPAAPAASAAEQLAAASAPDAAASGAAPFVWPASTRVSFELTGNFRGPVTGSAQVEWVHAGPRYQVHLDLLVGPAFAPIIARSMSSDGQITPTGLAPQRYDQETKLMLHDPSRATVLLEPEAVVLANGERRPTVPGVQDTASQFIQLTFRFSTEPGLLRVGNSVTIPLALPRYLDEWTYDVVDEDVLQTNFGPLATVHLRPRARPPRPGELRAEIWFAPRLRNLPVRIRVQQEAENYIDLLIAKRPELAAP